jgi:hypothetical protein
MLIPKSQKNGEKSEKSRGGLDDHVTHNKYK